MAVTKDVKETIIAKHAKHDGDTGSPEVQIAILTARIETLTDHKLVLVAETGERSVRYRLAYSRLFPN